MNDRMLAMEPDLLQQRAANVLLYAQVSTISAERTGQASAIDTRGQWKLEVFDGTALKFLIFTAWGS